MFHSFIIFDWIGNENELGLKETINEKNSILQKIPMFTVSNFNGEPLLVIANRRTNLHNLIMAISRNKTFVNSVDLKFHGPIRNNVANNEDI